jgi:hypothetical protein
MKTNKIGGCSSNANTYNYNEDNKNLLGNGLWYLQLSTMLVNLVRCLGVGFGYGWGDE